MVEQYKKRTEQEKDEVAKNAEEFSKNPFNKISQNPYPRCSDAHVVWHNAFYDARKLLSGNIGVMGSTS